MEFGLLGDLRVTVDGRPVPLDQPMPSRLLAVLICRAGTPVSVDALAEELWDSTRPATARVRCSRTPRSRVGGLAGARPTVGQ